MEALDKQFERDRRAAADERNSQRPDVRTMTDIQYVLKQLDPTNSLNKDLSDVTLSVDMKGSRGEHDRSNKATFRVNAKSSSSTYRAIMIEGMMVLQRRKDAAKEASAKLETLPLVVNDREMNPPDVLSVSEAVLSIDPLIDRLLGAYREGQHICWDLDDGFTYRYEIFEHRLTRRSRIEDGDTGLGSLSEHK